MFERLMFIGGPALTGIVGFFYIRSAFHAFRTGLAPTQKSGISKTENPPEFQRYVWGRLLGGGVLLVLAVTVAYVLNH